MEKSPLLTLSAGMIAGGIEGFVTYPTEYVKTQLQVSANFKSPWDVVKRTINTKGIRGLYKGVGPLVVGNSTKAGVRFMGFNYFKENGFGLVLSGLMAGILEATIVVTPTETIKTKLIHDQIQANPRFKSAIHGTSLILKEEGIKGIYKGVGAVIARQGANSAVRMSSYSVIREHFSKRFKVLI
jgi:solute carrier family 25 (mitochondrial citrate transporter), member 1